MSTFSMSERAPIVRIAVVVPVEGRGLQPAPEHAPRTVLAALELVAHHRHLGVEVLLRNERVDHPVGFHRERPVEILVGGGEGLEVVGAVEERGAVHPHAAAPELLEDVGIRGRALEQQMLEQVRHAGLAVAFLPRADEVGDVDGRRRLGRVGEEQHLETVGERKLGDALHRGALRDAGRQGGMGDRGDEGECGSDNEPDGSAGIGRGHGCLGSENGGAREYNRALASGQSREVSDHEPGNRFTESARNGIGPPGSGVRARCCRAGGTRRGRGHLNLATELGGLIDVYVNVM